MKVPLEKKGFNFMLRGETYVKGFKDKVARLMLMILKSGDLYEPIM